VGPLGPTTHLSRPTQPVLLPQTSSNVRGKSLPHKRLKEDNDVDSNDDFASSDEEDHVFTLSEVGSTFMEVAFKTKMNASTRKKRMAKLRFPDCKWSKAPELDAFIASTVPKDVVRADNTSHKTQRLWLEAAALLAAIVDKADAGEIGNTDIIQGIRNALLLLGNVSQQHSLQ